jgi:hypothetical protein
VKRFIGWVLAAAGATGTAWGAVSVMTGATRARLTITPDLSLSALTVGLIGLSVLTVGLIWVRD